MRSCQKDCVRFDHEITCVLRFKYIFFFVLFLYRQVPMDYLFIDHLCLKCSWADVLSFISSGKCFFVLLLLNYFISSSFSYRRDIIIMSLSLFHFFIEYHPNHCCPQKYLVKLFWLLLLLLVMVIDASIFLLHFTYLKVNVVSQKQGNKTKKKTRKTENNIVPDCCYDNNEGKSTLILIAVMHGWRRRRDNLLVVKWSENVF